VVKGLTYRSDTLPTPCSGTNRSILQQHFDLRLFGFQYVSGISSVVAVATNTKLLFIYITSAGIILLSVEVSWKACTEFYISKAFVQMEVLILPSIGVGLSLKTLEFKVRRLFHPFPHIVNSSPLFFVIHYSDITPEVYFPLAVFPELILVQQ